MMHYLTLEQQAELRAAARKTPDYSKPNGDLEHVIETMKRVNPFAFHTLASLPHRKFFHEPGPAVQHASFVMRLR